MKQERNIASQLCHTIWSELDSCTDQQRAELKKSHEDAWNMCWLFHMDLIIARRPAMIKLKLLLEDVRRCKQ